MRLENEHIELDRLDPPREDPTHHEAHEPVGVQVAKKYLHTRPDLGPEFYVALLSQYPSDRDAMIALLQKDRGNGFVAQMLESSPKTEAGHHHSRIELDHVMVMPD